MGYPMRLLAGIVLALGLTSPGLADNFQDILDKGEVRIGVPLDVPVYGFLDENQKPAGLDIDIANRLFEEMYR